MEDKVAERSKFNIRALASVTLFCSSVWLVSSGIVLLSSDDGVVTKWTDLFSTIHNTASLLFIIAAVVHVIMNWKVLIHYVNAKAGKYMRFKRELLIGVLGMSAVVMLVAFLDALHVL